MMTRCIGSIETLHLIISPTFSYPDVEPPRLKCPANKTITSKEKLQYGTAVWREPGTAG